MISILVPVYNSEFFIEECLSRLLNQAYPGQYEILVLDDNSSDKTAHVVLNHTGSRVKLIANKNRIGLTANINNGIANAKGEIIAFINPDCYITPDWLEKIQTSLLDFDFVGGPIYLFNAENIKYPWWWNRSLEWAIGLNTENCRIFFPLGGNSAFKKSVLLHMQNILPSAGPEYTYGDDFMRAKIASKMGYRMAFNRDMIAYHHVPSERLKFTAIIKRSIIEGRSWAVREKNILIFFQRFLAIFLNIIKFIFTLNMHYACRVVVSASYIMKSIKI